VKRNKCFAFLDVKEDNTCPC